MPPPPSSDLPAPPLPERADSQQATESGHPMDRPALVAALRGRIARLERGGALAGEATDPIRLCGPIDAALPAGGLERAALHEVAAEAPGAAAAFCALVLARTGNGTGTGTGGTVFWIGPDPDPWPPGMAQFGLDPARLVLVRAQKPADALWAAEEALRCPAVTGVLLAARRMDLTAGRRLMLAAATGGALGLILRPDQAEDGLDPSAALTRWRIGTLPGSGAARHDLGDPRWRLALLRARGARPQAWTATWHAGSESLGVEEETTPLPEQRRVRTRR